MSSGVATEGSINQTSSAQAAAQDGFKRFAGWSGILATAAFVVTIVVANMGGAEDPESAAEILPYLSEIGETAWPLYAYALAGIVLCILYVPWALGVFRLLGRSLPAWIGSAAVIIGLLFLVPAYMINGLVPFSWVPLADGGTSAETLYASYSLASGAAEGSFTIGSILSLGVGPLFIGLSWLRSEVGRRWIGQLAIAVGVTGVVWFVWLSTNPIVIALLLVNVLFSLVVFGATSKVLLSESRSTAR